MNNTTQRKIGRRPVSKVCSNCGGTFLYLGSHATRNKHFFCCYECYIAFKSMKIVVKCDWCGKDFVKKRSDVERTQHNFCSPNCCLEYRHMEGETTWNHRVNGQVKHRKVAEDKLGRKLAPGEEVHHIDGDHFNNDPENIEVLTKSEHAKIHASRKERKGNGQFTQKNATS